MIDEIEADLTLERAARLCPEHQSKRLPACPACTAYRMWVTGLPGQGFYGLITVRRKIRELLGQHLTLDEIGELCGLTGDTVRWLLTSARRAAGQRYIHGEFAGPLLDAKPGDFPLARRHKVDATGTKRMLAAMTLRRITASDVAAALGCSTTTVFEWKRLRLVPGPVAAAVAGLYERTRDRIGSGGDVSVEAAKAFGALPGRCWTADNINDPGYDPLAVLPDPVGVRRRLRAMQRDGHGPAFLAARLHEPVGTVVAWTVGGPVPAYAAPLVAALFEGGGLGLAGSTGDDREAQRRAEINGWDGSQAWYGINIDRPRQSASASGKLREHRRKTDYEQANVDGAAAGYRTRAELTLAELAEVVRVLAGRRMPAREIGAHLRWGSPETAANTVGKFAANHGIRLKPDLHAQAQKARARTLAA